MVDCHKCHRFNACYDDDDECIGFVPKTMTNADRIRSMSDKELAEFLMKPTRIIPKYECEDCENDCTECVLEWLREETKK